MLANNDPKLITLLLAKSLITQEQAARIKTEALDKGKNLSVFLVEQKIIDEEKLTEVKAEFFGLNYYNLADNDVPEAVLNFLPEDISRTYEIICFAKEDKNIKIGLVQPNLKAMEAVNFLAAEENLTVEYFLISSSSWSKAFKQYRPGS